VRLHHNTHLRFLHLDVWRGSESETGLASLLTQVVSVHMEEISLCLRHCPAYGYDVFHDCVPMEWADVDTILVGRQFSNLNSVSVRHTQFNSGKRDKEYPLEWFFNRLPLCRQRGMLRLCETKKRGPFM
jgi:hypothetical protein